MALASATLLLFGATTSDSSISGQGAARFLYGKHQLLLFEQMTELASQPK